MLLLTPSPFFFFIFGMKEGRINYSDSCHIQVAVKLCSPVFHLGGG